MILTYFTWNILLPEWEALIVGHASFTSFLSNQAISSHVIHHKQIFIFYEEGLQLHVVMHHLIVGKGDEMQVQNGAVMIQRISSKILTIGTP